MQAAVLVQYHAQGYSIAVFHPGMFASTWSRHDTLAKTKFTGGWEMSMLRQQERTFQERSSTTWVGCIWPWLLSFQYPK